MITLHVSGHCCDQCLPILLNAGEVETPDLDLAGSKLFHSNQVGALCWIFTLNIKLYCDLSFEGDVFPS